MNLIYNTQSPQTHFLTSFSEKPDLGHITACKNFVTSCYHLQYR